MSHSAALTELLQRLHAPQLASIELSLDRIHAHLAAAGNPHLCIPPVVHVAGTNGKGSTIAYLRAILEVAGYRCHVFTSPHLVHFHERIVVAGQMIADEQLLPLLEGVITRYEQFPLTFFEANAVAAFQAFAAHPADITLLEVGMGGRFDATNVIASPLLSIITPVSLDHTEFLGDTLAKIAFEKAGIIKAGCPVVVAPQALEVAEAIERSCSKMGAPLVPVVAAAPVVPNLAGEHQAMNAATACAAIEQLRKAGWNISDQAVRYGLTHAWWPARLQRLTDGSLAQPLPTGWQLWLDGGHNPSAAEMLAAWAASHQPLHVIVGMTAHKDATAFLQALAPVAQSIHLIEIPNEPMAMPLPRLMEAACAANITVVAQPSVKDAIMMILQANSSESGYILICGSLYLAGFVLGNAEDEGDV